MVALRKRKQTKTGKYSLYLDIYEGSFKTSEGKIKNKRTYEYLKLYLFDKPTNETERQHNKEMLKIANLVRAKRELELSANKHGIKFESKNKIMLLDYFWNFYSNIKLKSDNWKNAYNKLKMFVKEDVPVTSVSADFIKMFLLFLENSGRTGGVKKSTIKQNTANIYFDLFFRVVRQAVKDELLPNKTIVDIKRPKKVEVEKEYLTIDEIKTLNSVLECQRSRTISQEVKDKVWNRDGGKCVECGSNRRLEFDHIVPFSKGGSNTYRNIQLLCEPCNRKKSNKIG